MGSYDSTNEITNEIKKLKGFGMSDDEIDQVLEDDGVEPGYRRSAFQRAKVS